MPTALPVRCSICNQYICPFISCVCVLSLEPQAAPETHDEVSSPGPATETTAPATAAPTGGADTVPAVQQAPGTAPPPAHAPTSVLASSVTSVVLAGWHSSKHADSPARPGAVPLFSHVALSFQWCEWDCACWRVLHSAHFLTMASPPPDETRRYPPRQRGGMFCKRFVTHDCWRSMYGACCSCKRPLFVFAAQVGVAAAHVTLNEGGNELFADMLSSYNSGVYCT